MGNPVERVKFGAAVGRAINAALARSESARGEDEKVVGIVGGGDSFDQFAVIARRQAGAGELAPVRAVVRCLINARAMSALFAAGRDHF